MKFLEKQIQKKNDEILRYELFFIFYFFMNLSDFSFFSVMMKITINSLGDAVLFVWNKWKNRLEHAYAVMAWALSLQPNIRVYCMEQLSTNYRDLRKIVDIPGCIICHVPTKK